MRDPQTVPPPTRASAPELRAVRPGPLPSCPVCADAPERISWRQRPGEPVLLVFEPCGHRHGSPAPPVLAVTPPAPYPGR
ncbi:hypothetical protein ABZW32_34275 [Streptomyces sp. NPDC004667]|uniref:hypothetical protein n=1 Tax=Streptomyces sp. NPDC004667 TaxID=3154285 RepID=UPI0033A4A60C